MPKLSASMPENCGKYFTQILVFRVFLQVVQNTLRIFQKLADKNLRKFFDISRSCPVFLMILRNTDCPHMMC